MTSKPVLFIVGTIKNFILYIYIYVSYSADGGLPCNIKVNYVTLTIGTPILTKSNYFLFLNINIIFFWKQMTSSIIATNNDTHFDCYVTFFINIILV